MIRFHGRNNNNIISGLVLATLMGMSGAVAIAAAIQESPRHCVVVRRLYLMGLSVW